jgi:23S rRNA pseudouridine1911/1915/1917 synthase
MENELETIFIQENEVGVRLDKVLSTRFGQKSRSYFQYLIENEAVFLNGQKVKKSTLAKAGDEIEIFFIATPEISLEPENIPLDILFEDDHLLVINKPAGMVVHPAFGHYNHTFVNALLFHCKNLPRGETYRPGIVHRIDKDTSGVLLAAKTEIAHELLISAFQRHEISKQYLAICIGTPSKLTLSAPIGRHPTKRKEMSIVDQGKEAITNFEILSKSDHLSLVLAKPISGRTHQIRVHLKGLNSPILGDEIYGNKRINKALNVERQLLHAYKLNLIHPITKEPLSFCAPLPSDISQFITIFKLAQYNNI